MQSTMIPSRMLLALLSLTPSVAVHARTPAPATVLTLTAEAIMARVAVNQDRTETARSQFVYVQHARVQSRKGGRILCEETSETRIAPSPRGQTQVLLSLTGYVREGNRSIRYTSLPGTPADGRDDGTGSKADSDSLTVNVGDKRTVLDADAKNQPVQVSDTDLDLVEHMRQHMTSDTGSKDGVEAGLFPLTSKQQQGMRFVLKGRETKNGRDTFHILFRPKDKSEYGWRGEAWIDADAFQPVVVRTALSRSLPLGVRALLGTNVPGLGFTAIYAPQQSGVWFPSSFGTEFKIKVLFMFHRDIVVAVENRDFERTHVQSTIHTEDSKVLSPQENAPKP